MRPSRSCLPVRGPCLAWLPGIVLLVWLSACGSSSPDAPVPGRTIGSADAVVSSPPGNASRASLAARQAPTPETRSTDSSRATRPAPPARVQTAASSRDTPPPDELTTAEQAQREARQLWFAEVRENPDVTVRLQALELWAEQPGDGMDPLTYALVDEDEQVRAQELWEEQFIQEVEADAP